MAAADDLRLFKHENKLAVIERILLQYRQGLFSIVLIFSSELFTAVWQSTYPSGQNCGLYQTGLIGSSSSSFSVCVMVSFYASHLYISLSFACAVHVRAFYTISIGHTFWNFTGFAVKFAMYTKTSSPCRISIRAGAVLEYRCLAFSQYTEFSWAQQQAEWPILSLGYESVSKVDVQRTRNCVRRIFHHYLIFLYPLRRYYRLISNSSRSSP